MQAERRTPLSSLVLRKSLVPRYTRRKGDDYLNGLFCVGIFPKAPRLIAGLFSCLERVAQRDKNKVGCSLLMLRVIYMYHSTYYSTVITYVPPSYGTVYVLQHPTAATILLPLAANRLNTSFTPSLSGINQGSCSLNTAFTNPDNRTSFTARFASRKALLREQLHQCLQATS